MRSESNLDEDHPRGCGEHVMLNSLPHFWAGSSPRMRGAHRSLQQTTEIRRIIPADAGSTMRGEGLWMARKDHPRGCGEHRSPNMDKRIIAGSSPRTRGAHVIIICICNVIGIIPADAGSTCSGLPG